MYGAMVQRTGCRKEWIRDGANEVFDGQQHDLDVKNLSEDV